MVAEPTTSAVPARLAGALVRYRLMAYTTGTMLIALVFVAMPIKYLGHHEGPVAVLGAAHGFLYTVYLLAAFWLAVQGRWSMKGTVLVLLAGTIPFVSFYAERRVTANVRAGRRL